MPWSAKFIEAISSPVLSSQRAFFLRVVTLYREPGIAGYTVTSHRELMSGADNRVNISKIDPAGQTLTPQTWASVLGAFDVYVVGDPSELLQNITRGSTVEVCMGFPGWATADYQPILLGRVTRIAREGLGAEWRISCLDVISAASQRLDTSSAKLGLFYSLADTTLTADSAVADGTYDGVVFNSFEKSTASNGAALVTPTSGEPYFRLWSAVGAATMTVASPGTASVMGTTDVGALTGSVVQEVGYLEGHPSTVARQVLSSRGSAANGNYDVLPESWGLGISQAYFDDADIARWLGIVQPASGTYVVQFACTDMVDDPRSFLESSVLAPFGLFLAIRQGRITIRAAQDPVIDTGYDVDFELTIDDVISVEAWEAFDPDVTEHEYVVGIYSGGTVVTSAAAIATLPAVSTAIIDVSTSTFTNGSAIVTEIEGRLAAYYTRIPEVLRCKTTLRAAQLTVGDRIKVTLGAPWVWSRRDGAGGYDRRRAVVTHVTPDCWVGTCILEVRIYPDGEGRWE